MGAGWLRGVMLFQLGCRCVRQRWKKVAAAATLPVLNFHRCANFCFVFTWFLKVFAFFCANFCIFVYFVVAFFAHILCAYFRLKV